MNGADIQHTYGLDMDEPAARVLVYKYIAINESVKATTRMFGVYRKRKINNTNYDNFSPLSYGTNVMGRKCDATLSRLLIM